MSYIEKINSPNDLKKLKREELVKYAEEVRGLIATTVMQNGGHLASNLGIVELTIALHYVFNAPTDKLIFDVGHQTYAHKIITGRRDRFSTLRQDDGISGFPRRTESEYDEFTTGHSSTSLSLGVGMARARRLRQEDYSIVSIIGDGALTGGMAFEALNDIGANREKVIIVLNDNKMSISKNVGAMSNYLAKLRLSNKYSSFKTNFKKGVQALPFFGDKLVSIFDKAKDSIKISLLRDKIFENLGIKYYGPIDGHDLNALIGILKKLKNSKYPVLLHVITKKGKGVNEIEQAPEFYHGVSAKRDVSNEILYSAVVSETLCEMAENDASFVAVSAAMSSGTGLKVFSEKYKDRYYDVGIAEQHAVSMCVGLSRAGIKPYFAVYSSFLQRAYDQILHDVCIDNENVTFLIDHAGVVDGDGVTHQGLFDISYLSSMPNMTVMQPKDGNELKQMIEFSRKYNGALAIRYPKSFSTNYKAEKSNVDLLSWEVLKKGKSNIVIFAVGNKMIDIALSIDNSTVINARTIKPLDENALKAVKENSIVVTLEDGIERGGFGESVSNYYKKNGSSIKCLVLAHPDKFIEHTSETSIYKNNGITKENILNMIEKCVETLE